MRYLKDLYIADGLSGIDAAALLSRVSEGKKVPNLYFLTMPTNPANQLDIVHTLFLRQKKLRKYLPAVVGIAPDRRSAAALVERILRETMEKTGGTDMRRYLLSMETASSGED